MATYTELERRIESVGLAARGGFHPQLSEGISDLDGRPVLTLIMIGFTGVTHWARFADSPEYRDDLPNPLDRWSKRIVDALADEFGARALYPFGDPPWWPFQRWARQALALHVSPLGVLIDPMFGLWHSYRAALALTTDVALPAPVPWPDPCGPCQSKPCLHTCPVGAVQQGSYMVDACRSYVQAVESDCRTAGCLARRACPVGVQYAYQPLQAAFHMRAFAERNRVNN